MALRLFTLPTIPEALTASADRAQYLAEHYWDNTPLSVSLIDEHPQEFEQFLVDYLSILPIVNPELQPSLLNPLFTIATPQLRKYLTEAQSPVANPDIYRASLLSLVEGQSRIEAHFRYRQKCEVCLETMEQIDKSEIIRRAQDSQKLILRIEQTTEEPQLRLFSSDGTCLANDINVNELELLLQELSK